MMDRSFVVSVACVLALSSNFLRAADGDLAAIRSEMQLMREAYESRIAALESEVKAFKQSGVAQPKSVERSIIDSLFKKDGTTPPPDYSRLSVSTVSAVKGSTQITLGGYTEFTYTDRTTRTPEFEQLKTVAEVSAKIDDRIHLYLEVEQENGGVIAGPEPTNGEFEIEQAYLDYAIDKALNFRAGVSLIPVGHYNLYHEGFLNNLVDRPLVDRRIIPTTWYEAGLGFNGTPVDNDSMGLSYEAYMYNPEKGNGVDPLSGFRGIRNENKTPNSDQKAGAARLAFELARGFKNVADTLEFGLSGYVSGFAGFNSANAGGDLVRFPSGRLYVSAADVTWEKKNLGFRGEAARAHSDAGENSVGKQQTGWGYYAEGYYKFWPQFLSSSPFGKFKDPKLVAALRYDYVDLNTQADATPSIQRLTAGMGYRPIPRTVFKFDYQFDLLGSGLVGHDYDESETGLKKHTRAFLFSVTTGF